MNHRRFHLLEKIQVQLAAAAAFLAVYFLVWPILRPADPHYPLAFLPANSYVTGFAFAGTVWVLAAACALMTVSSRPEGALVAALIGAAGASARSSQMRFLLWQSADNLAGVYCVLILEVLALCVVLLVAGGIVDLVRAAVAGIKPGWLWKPAIIRLPDAGRGRPRADSGSPGFMEGGDIAARRYLVLYIVQYLFAPKGGRKAGGAAAGRRALRLSACCLGLGLVVAVVLLSLMMQSSDRGQILFALLAAFLVAAGIAHQVFPTPHSIVVWGMPILVAIGAYALAALSAGHPDGSWMDMPRYSKALPTDWLTAGCGGALIGFWISERIHELRHIERAEAQHSQ